MRYIVRGVLYKYKYCVCIAVDLAMYNAQDLAFQIWRRISTRRKFPIDDAMMPTCRYDCIKFSLMALAAAAYAIDVAKGGEQKRRQP